MSDLRCSHISSIDQLRAETAAWDDLWLRSDVAAPTARAELICQWVEQFQPRRELHALVVADGERWLAALPLVPCRVGRLIRAHDLPSNSWSRCGELLLDPAAESIAAMDRLLTAAGEVAGQLLWLNETVPESPHWQALAQACERAGSAICAHERFRVGRVEIGADWEAYKKELPKNHRQGVARALRRLQAEGDVRFEMNSRMAVAEVEPWLREAFALEDRGWKGDAGSSVLRAAGMFDFFARQAGQLAQWGQLETAALRLDRRLLAFVYGFRAKGVYFAHKISYDPEFADFGPGQLLFNHILEQLHADGRTRALDFIGPLNQSLSRWRPASYGIGRLAIAPRRLLGAAALYVYRNCWRRSCAR